MKELWISESEHITCVLILNIKVIYNYLRTNYRNFMKTLLKVIEKFY